MERLMENSAQDRVREATTNLRARLGRARESLVGRADFSVQDIRAISGRLGLMEPIVSEAGDLRAKDSDLDAELKTYAETLKELQGTLEQVRFMLLARQTQLAAARSHLETVGLWAKTLNQTR
jgi:hypothetical protein